MGVQPAGELHEGVGVPVHPIYAVQWYVVCAIVTGALGAVVGVSACAYKCYVRRSANSATNRLSAAIKKGLKEGGASGGGGGGSMKKSASTRSTASAKSTSSSRSGRSVRGGVEGSDAGTTPLMQGHQQAGDGHHGSERCASRSPSAQNVDPTKTEYYVDDETKQGAVTGDEGEGGHLVQSPTEKDEKLREKAVDDLKLSKLGTLHFNVEYDRQKMALVVTIVRACALPAKDPNIGSSDPYVKLQLLPEKRHKVKTRVLRKTINPIYDEIFTFYGVDFNQLHSTTLHFVVLSFDRFSRDDIIGEVLFPLAGVDIGEQEIAICRDISPRHIKMHSQGRGELLVSLCYQPAANRLTVVVLKARNLPKMDITGLSDPYVKIYLLYNGQRISKKKTHVKKRTLNPVFNESFLFDVPSNEGLHSISLEFLVLDWDRVTKNEVIGRLEVGAKIVGPETHHWNEVMNCPRKQIAEWHKLKE